MNESLHWYENEEQIKHITGTMRIRSFRNNDERRSIYALHRI